MPLPAQEGPAAEGGYCHPNPYADPDVTTSPS